MPSVPVLLVVVVLVGVLVQVVFGVGVGMSVAKDLVTLQGKQIPTTSVNFTTTVNKACQCKMQCFTIPKCQCVTAEVVSDESVLCHVSYQDVDFTSLVDSDNSESVTFYWRKYELVGSLYYRVVKEHASWWGASKVCRLEGGQLMVATSDLFKTHLISLFVRHGLEECWMGLFAPKKDGRKAGIDSPSWEFSSGYKLLQPINDQNTNHRCFRAYLDSSSTKVDFANLNNCADGGPYICQRNY